MTRGVVVGVMMSRKRLGEQHRQQQPSARACLFGSGEGSSDGGLLGFPPTPTQCEHTIAMRSPGASGLEGGSCAIYKGTWLACQRKAIAAGQAAASKKGSKKRLPASDESSSWWACLGAKPCCCRRRELAGRAQLRRVGGVHTGLWQHGARAQLLSHPIRQAPVATASYIELRPNASGGLSHAVGGAGFE